jgi:hypothetical protein
MTRRNGKGARALDDATCPKEHFNEQLGQESRSFRREPVFRPVHRLRVLF